MTGLFAAVLSSALPEEERLTTPRAIFLSNRAQAFEKSGFAGEKQG
jgi:hypothetical protein